MRLDPRVIPTGIVVLCLLAAATARHDVGKAGYWVICAILFAWVTYAMR